LKHFGKLYQVMTTLDTTQANSVTGCDPLGLVTAQKRFHFYAALGAYLSENQ